jgi:hypothetical protein
VHARGLTATIRLEVWTVTWSATLAAPMPTPQMHGVILGPLTEVYPDRIVVGGARTLFLRDGEACRYEIGIGLEVIFTEQDDGRGSVQRITPLEPRPRSSWASSRCSGSSG